MKALLVVDVIENNTRTVTTLKNKLSSIEHVEQVVIKIFNEEEGRLSNSDDLNLEEFSYLAIDDYSPESHTSMVKVFELFKNHPVKKIIFANMFEIERCLFLHEEFLPDVINDRYSDINTFIASLTEKGILNES